MTRRVPVTAAKRVATEHNLDQVIIVGFRKEDGTTHIITYGKTKLECSQAATGGRKIAKALNLRMDIPTEKKP